MNGDRNIDVAAIRERLEATEKGAYTWGACGHEWTNLKDARALLDALDAAHVDREELHTVVRMLAEAWIAADGEPATRDDLTALTTVNRLGAQLLAAIDAALSTGNGPAEGRDPVEVVQVRLHRTPGVECSHIEGKQPACWRDAFRAVSALRANGLLP